MNWRTCSVVSDEAHNADTVAANIGASEATPTVLATGSMAKYLRAKAPSVGNVF